MEDKILEFIETKKELRPTGIMIIKRLLPEVIEGITFQKVLTMERFQFSDEGDTIYVEYDLDYFNSEGVNVNKLLNVQRGSFYINSDNKIAVRDPETFEPILEPLVDINGEILLDVDGNEVIRPKLESAMKLLKSFADVIPITTILKFYMDDRDRDGLFNRSLLDD